MQLNKRFLYFIFSLLSIFLAQIIFLSLKDSNLKQKQEFVKNLNIIDFAFFENSLYVRHPFSHEAGEVFNKYPGYLESDLSTFSATGLKEFYE